MINERIISLLRKAFQNFSGIRNVSLFVAQQIINNLLYTHLLFCRGVGKQHRPQYKLVDSGADLSNIDLTDFIDHLFYGIWGSVTNRDSDRRRGQIRLDVAFQPAAELGVGENGVEQLQEYPGMFCLIAGVPNYGIGQVGPIRGNAPSENREFSGAVCFLYGIGNQTA